MTTWTWTLGLLYADDVGVARAVDWTLTGTAEGRSASRFGRAWLGPPGETVVPLEAVDDSVVLEWLAGRIAIDGVQAGILQDLYPVIGDVGPVASAVTVPEALTAFVLVGEAPADTRARLAARWQELTHLLQMGLADSDLAHEHTLLSAHQGWLTS